MISQFKKHGIALDEVKKVLRNDNGVNRQDYECEEQSPTGNDRSMLVGFSRPNRLIEVGIEWEKDASEEIIGAVVFHAMKVTQPYQQAYFEEL